MDENVVKKFLEHSVSKHILEAYTKKVTIPAAPTKYILRIYSDGSISKATNYYKKSSEAQNTILYRNKLYVGQVVRVHYSNESLTELYIGGKPFNVKKPITLKKDSQFVLKYIGSTPTPEATEAVFVEVVIQGNVID